MIELTLYDPMRPDNIGDKIVVNPDQVRSYLRQSSFTSIEFTNGNRIEVIEEPMRIAQLAVMWIRIENNSLEFKNMTSELKKLGDKVTSAIEQNGASEIYNKVKEIEENSRKTKATIKTWAATQPVAVIQPPKLSLFQRLKALFR